MNEYIDIDRLNELVEEQKNEICERHKNDICDRCLNEWHPDNDQPGPCPQTHCQDARNRYFEEWLED